MAGSIPEQAIDARKAAVDEVEKLLQHPEDLKRLPDMLEEYTLKLQVVCCKHMHTVLALTITT